jgi:hypothetical protein
VAQEPAPVQGSFGTMPRYHLNVFDDLETQDPEGDDFPDLAAATEAAIDGARGLMSDHVRYGRPIDLTHRIEVADSAGKVFATLRFADLITIRG